MGLAPPAVVTVTSTVPVPAGDVAVIELAEFTLKLAALAEPNLTLETSLKLVPVIVTAVPPAEGPLLGLTPTTDGAAGGGGGGSLLPTMRCAIAWRSLRPPVPPLKPRYALVGSVT